jgi:hypothetical protein
MTNTTSSGPDFICVGAQKAGTRWLYDQMDNCSDVWMTPIKELNYFCGAFNKPTNMKVIEAHREKLASGSDEVSAEAVAFFKTLEGLSADGPRSHQDYFSLFSPKGQRLSGDISPIYATASPEQARATAAALPQAQLIFLIRHPVSRIKSALSMHVRHGKVSERALLSWKQLLPVVGNKSYAVRSLATKSWQTWTEAFGVQRCGYWFFDDIVSRPEEVRTEIARHAGVKNPAFGIPADFNRKEGDEKYPFSEEVNVRLHQFLAAEIEACKQTFGGRALEWKSSLMPAGAAG